MTKLSWLGLFNWVFHVNGNLKHTKTILYHLDMQILMKSKMSDFIVSILGKKMKGYNVKKRLRRGRV